MSRDRVPGESCSCRRVRGTKTIIHNNFQPKFRVKLAHNELECWKKKIVSIEKSISLGQTHFRHGGFPVDREDLTRPEICHPLVSAGETQKPCVGALTSRRPNHNTVSAPREGSKSPLEKWVIYGSPKVLRTPEGSGVSSETNSLILSGSAHLSAFFSPCPSSCCLFFPPFLFPERHGLKRNFVQDTKERRSRLGNRLRPFSAPTSDSSALSGEPEMTSR